MHLPDSVASAFSLKQMESCRVHKAYVIDSNIRICNHVRLFTNFTAY